jgi:GGDEF domain-containing protein
VWELPLERAVRVRLGVYLATGSRFALVVLRVLRFEEVVSYYGEESSQRIVNAVSRRGLRLLGPDAQHFELPGGRVAFLFETETDGARGGADRSKDLFWTDPSDIEGLAMSLGRKACEHLVDGHRVECVVGWASAPADGLIADDLMEVAEAGAQSTAAFRRVAGGQVRVPEELG